MTGDELLDVMEHIDPELLAEADVLPKRQQTSAIRLIAALAAMLAVLIGIAFLMGNLAGGPAQMGSQPTHGSNRFPFPSSGTSGLRPSVNYSSHPATRPTISPPQSSSPSNFHFDSIAQLKQMLTIAKEQPDALIGYVHSENIGYWDNYYPTQSDVALLEKWLQSIVVPCRRDHKDTLNSIYYHPERFYDKDRLEFFYDVNGIRYCFMVCDSPAWNPDGDKVTTVQIGSYTAEMREGSYGTSRRLMAHFYVNDVVISMWINTTDPNEIDLSGFFFSTILAVE